MRSLQSNVTVGQSLLKALDAFVADLTFREQYVGWAEADQRGKTLNSPKNSAVPKDAAAG